MILVDTSVWIGHLREGDQMMFELLDRGRILCHPFVVGEIAVGMFRSRDTIIAQLRKLPRVSVGTDEEVLRLISDRKLYGCGVGYIDMHLLASVLLTADARLWTRDRRLNEVSKSLGVAFPAIQ
jgi:predicted nucleic acid-binding protein